MGEDGAGDGLRQVQDQRKEAAQDSNDEALWPEADRAAWRTAWRLEGRGRFSEEEAEAWLKKLFSHRQERTICSRFKRGGVPEVGTVLCDGTRL